MGYQPRKSDKGPKWAEHLSSLIKRHGSKDRCFWLSEEVHDCLESYVSKKQHSAIGRDILDDYFGAWIDEGSEECLKGKNFRVTKRGNQLSPEVVDVITVIEREAQFTDDKVKADEEQAIKDAYKSCAKCKYSGPKDRNRFYRHESEEYNCEYPRWNRPPEKEANPEGLCTQWVSLKKYKGVEAEYFSDHPSALTVTAVSSLVSVLLMSISSIIIAWCFAVGLLFIFTVAYIKKNI